MLRLMTVLAALALLAAPTAEAASRNKIIKDCADDGQLQGHYSPSELRDARQHLPSDVAEYTDCADVLRRAELPPGAGSSGSGGGGTGSHATSGADAAAGGGGHELLSPSTAADSKALADAGTNGDQPVEVDGTRVVPGASGLHADAARNSLPGPIVLALVLLGATAGALTLPSVRRKLPRFGQR